MRTSGTRLCVGKFLEHCALRRAHAFLIPQKSMEKRRAKEGCFRASLWKLPARRQLSKSLRAYAVAVLLCEASISAKLPPLRRRLRVPLRRARRPRRAASIGHHRSSAGAKRGGADVEADFFDNRPVISAQTAGCFQRGARKHPSLVRLFSMLFCGIRKAWPPGGGTLLTALRIRLSYRLSAKSFSRYILPFPRPLCRRSGGMPCRRGCAWPPPEWGRASRQRPRPRRA